jgi:hypothetical protein
MSKNYPYQENKNRRIAGLKKATQRCSMAVGKFSRKEDMPMAEFLADVLAATVAGVLVFFIVRWLDRR